MKDSDPRPLSDAAPPSAEQRIERALYRCRWLLMPLYLGLSLTLLLVAIKFFQELLHCLLIVFTISESDLILAVLSLIDLTLVGSLVVIVMFSGYENFVSQLDTGPSPEKLEWLGKHDYSSLKMKVAASVVAISSIQLLKIFMNVQMVPNDKILWYVVIHLTLAVSALLMGYLDHMAKRG